MTQTTTPPIHVLFVKGEPVAVSAKPFDLPQYGDPSAISQQACVPKEALAVAFNRGWDANQSPTAQNEQATQAKAELCYSSCGERYYDDFQSIIHNLEVGSSYFVAEQVEPTINALSLGETIHEHIADQLDQEVGEVAELFDLTLEQRKELGQIVLDKIKEYGGYHCYGVANVRTETVTADDLGAES